MTQDSLNIQHLEHGSIFISRFIIHYFTTSLFTKHPEIANQIDYTNIRGQDYKILASGGLNFSQLSQEQINNINLGSIPTVDLVNLANAQLSFSQFSDESIGNINFGQLPGSDYKILANSGLNFSALTEENIKNISLYSIPTGDLKFVAEAGLDFGRFANSSIRNLDFDQLPGSDYKILANSGLNFSVLTEENLNDINMYLIPTGDLKFLAEAGLDFGRFDDAAIRNIKFNEIAKEDLEILKTQGLSLEPLNGIDLGSVKLRAFVGLGYMPDIDFTSIEDLDENSSFSELYYSFAEEPDLNFDFNNDDGTKVAGISIDELLRQILGKITGQTTFEPAEKTYNNKGQLTDGKDTVIRELQASHETGTFSNGKSQFLNQYTGEAADRLVLDAARLADHLGIWTDGGRKAKVKIENGVIGTLSSGEPTQWITIHRRANGSVHGHPSSPPTNLK